MFIPDLERFKRKYDNGFDFGEVTHKLLSHEEATPQAQERRRKAREAWQKRKGQYNATRKAKGWR